MPDKITHPIEDFLMNSENTMQASKEMVGQTLKPYQSPGLRIFGSISSLTNSAAGSCNSDNLACTPVPGGNMRMSERHLKENITRVGTHPLGIGLYLFDYRPHLFGDSMQKRQFGVMVDEVEKVMPEAVSVLPNSYKIVNYAMLGISLSLN